VVKGGEFEFFSNDLARKIFTDPAPPEGEGRKKRKKRGLRGKKKIGFFLPEGKKKT